jgi:2-methylcitrate dehydratase PrpD
VEVEVVLKNGMRDAISIDNPPGHPSRELTWDDIHAKFMDCAAHASLPADRARRAFDLIRTLEKLDDVAKMLELLR